MYRLRNADLDDINEIKEITEKIQNELNIYENIRSSRIKPKSHLFGT
jgi:hypothetical protein